MASEFFEDDGDEDLLAILESGIVQSLGRVATAAAAPDDLGHAKPLAKKLRAMRSPVNHELRGDPSLSRWQLKYVDEPFDGSRHPCDYSSSRFGRQFRNHFRMPRATWKVLVQRVSSQPWAAYVRREDAVHTSRCVVGRADSCIPYGPRTRATI